MKHLLLTIPLLLLTACATPVTQMPQTDRAAVEAERKQHLLLASEEKLREQETRTRNMNEQRDKLLKISAPISRAALELCGTLVESTEPCVYDFELSDQKEMNAYADGKKVVITPAMMNFAETDDELAIVLGHELAHNMMQHGNAAKRNALAGAVLGAVLDAVAASQGINTGSAFAQGGAESGMLRYSAAFEAEADYVGLYIAARAGYTIDNAPSFWRRMSVRNPEAIYISTTHPSNPERSVAVQKAIEEIKTKQAQGLALLPEKQTKGS